MSSLKSEGKVIELSKGTFIGMLTIKHGENKREICTPKASKAETYMNMFALPEYQANPVKLKLI